MIRLKARDGEVKVLREPQAMWMMYAEMRGGVKFWCATEDEYAKIRASDLMKYAISE